MNLTRVGVRKGETRRGGEKERRESGRERQRKTEREEGDRETDRQTDTWGKQMDLEPRKEQMCSRAQRWVGKRMFRCP